MSVSFIVPSINRKSLYETIASIEVWPGDEILVEFDIPRMDMWGNPQRNEAMLRAKCDFLAFIDDDDAYVLGHRRLMAKAIEANPKDLTLFKMQYPNGDKLWATPDVIPGNIGSPMILVPNDPKRCHHWEGARNMADVLFVQGWLGEVVWRNEIIAYLGHNDNEPNAEGL